MSESISYSGIFHSTYFGPKCMVRIAGENSQNLILIPLTFGCLTDMAMLANDSTFQVITIIPPFINDLNKSDFAAFLLTFVSLKKNVRILYPDAVKYDIPGGVSGYIERQHITDPTKLASISGLNCGVQFIRLPGDDENACYMLKLYTEKSLQFFVPFIPITDTTDALSFIMDLDNADRASKIHVPYLRTPIGGVSGYQVFCSLKGDLAPATNMVVDKMRNQFYGRIVFNNFGCSSEIVGIENAHPNVGFTAASAVRPTF